MNISIKTGPGSNLITIAIPPHITLCSPHDRHKNCTRIISSFQLTNKRRRKPSWWEKAPPTSFSFFDDSAVKWSEWVWQFRWLELVDVCTVPWKRFVYKQSWWRKIFDAHRAVSRRLGEVISNEEVLPYARTITCTVIFCWMSSLHF